MAHGEDRMERLLGALGVGPGELDGEVPEGRHRRREGVPLLRLPAALRSAHVRVPSAAVGGLVAVLVVVAVVLGVRVAWAERTAAPTPVPVATTAPGHGAGGQGAPTRPEGGSADPALPGGTGSPAVPTDTSPTATAPAVADLVVHVIGAVTEPGVVEVRPGARVQDVVDRAGGPREDADLGRLNLARVVADGERVWVPVHGEEPPDEVTGPSAQQAPGAPSTAGADGAAVSAVVDLNSADQGLLESLPGVGPVTAAAILQWRADHGRFSSVDELVEVSGIGPKTLETLRPHVTAGP
jgi:competence protein ComEA